jgi:hypothetical protein
MNNKRKMKKNKNKKIKNFKKKKEILWPCQASPWPSLPDPEASASPGAARRGESEKYSVKKGRECEL